ncbi:flagellar biosynthesis protein FlhB [candidate division KSB1 bacterium]
MPEENQQEKTEQATPKRSEEARKKGQVPKSIELNTAVILFGSLLFLYFAGGTVFTRMAYYSQVVFENISNVRLTPQNIPDYTLMAFVNSMKIAGPVILAVMFFGLVSAFSQVGFMMSLEPLIPKWEKISPLSGFKRMFSRRSFIELIKGVLKILIVGIIGYLEVKRNISEYIQLSDMEPVSIFKFGCHAAFVLGIKITLVLLVLALFDFMFQRWDHAKKIMMTKQEIKEELKQMEGDPLVKARIRSIQREMARTRMMQEIPKADVVITNPTKLAIALKYEPIEMDAPLVIAKGARKMAEKIKEIAREHGIAIVEDKPLAQALYKAVNVGDEVPEKFFQAIAEILAYVYKLKNKRVS